MLAAMAIEHNGWGIKRRPMGTITAEGSIKLAVICITYGDYKILHSLGPHDIVLVGYVPENRISGYSKGVIISNPSICLVQKVKRGTS